MPGLFGSSYFGDATGTDDAAAVVVATVNRPRYSVRDLAPIAQGSAPAEAFTVLDYNEDAVDLTGKTLRLVVASRDSGDDADSLYDDTLTGSFKYETGGSGITIGGSGNNVVTVQFDAADTGTAGAFDYFLWNITDNVLLVRGGVSIRPAIDDI